jgi:ankyrin repeat protein
MKNPYIIPAAIIGAAILAGFWMLKPPSKPQKVIVVHRPDISIHEAAAGFRGGNIEAVKQHLEAGTDVNLVGGGEKTPLMSALHWDNIEIAKLLLSNGANVKVKDHKGRTPLMLVAGTGNKELVELFIAEGANVNAQSIGGGTPLDWAKDHPQIAELLHKHGGKTGEELKADLK